MPKQMSATFKKYRGVVIESIIETRDNSSSSTEALEETLDILQFHLPADVLVPINPTVLSTPKYFAEQYSDAHRAIGYGEKSSAVKKSKARYDAIRGLSKALHAFATEHDFLYWLAHGTLVGQHWGGKPLSFDDDLDIQTTFEALHKMWPYRNQMFAERYTLQINPWYLRRTSLNNKKVGGPRFGINHETKQRIVLPKRQEPNVIDARFIDTETGVFADITVLSAEVADDFWYDQEEGRAKAHNMERVHDKSVHTYDFHDISPLRQCTFEGLPHWCPNKAVEIMSREYPKALNNHYSFFRFDYKEETFKEVSCEALAEMYTTPTPDNCDAQCAEIVKQDREILWTPDRSRPQECGLFIRFPDKNPEGRIKPMRKLSFLGKHSGGDLPELPDEAPLPDPTESAVPEGQIVDVPLQ